MFQGWFDTTTGPKRETTSYLRIADALGFATAEVLFLSDVQAEIDAASGAGMATALLGRDGAPGIPDFYGIDQISQHGGA
jgi:enolase-phosphatase E1